jgi:hypothetical protein
MLDAIDSIVYQGGVAIFGACVCAHLCAIK